MRLFGTTLVRKIMTTADAIAAVDPLELQTGQIGREVGDAVLAQCAICLTALESALTAGMDPRETIEVTGTGRSGTRTLTLTELQLWCRERMIFANEGLFRTRIQQALLQAGVWVGDLDEPGTLSEDQAILATETGRCLLEVLRDAQAAGISERLQVAWKSTTITIRAAMKLGEYVENTGWRKMPFLASEKERGFRG